VCLAGPLLIPVAVRPSGDLPFTAEELEKLEAGGVVVRHEERELSENEFTSMLVGAVLVRHPEEVIWEVLNHPERDIEWIPGVRKSELVSDACPTPTTRVNVTDTTIGAFGIEAYYSFVREYDYEKRTIKAHMDKDRPHRFFQDIKAGWDFFPYKGGTIFQYWSDSKMVIDLPDFISEYLGEKTVIAGVASVAKRCDDIAEEMKEKKPKPPCPVPDKRQSEKD
jgi:carbon monoxide dehydrogenase subunit G